MDSAGNSSEDNYDIGSLSFGDETDEEDNPKKKIPKWALRKFWLTFEK